MRKYKIVIIDDEEAVIDTILKAVKTILSMDVGYEISYKILKNQEEIDDMNEIAADIVLFDCAMGAAPLNFGESDETTFGMELMRRFRENNARTKIIFYSANISSSGVYCYDFTNEEILSLINNIHVFKMIPKKAEDIVNAIKEAVEELDAVIVSLEDLKEEYHSDGQFLVDGRLYTIEELVSEVKKNTDIGEKFRKSILENIITYMMKFGGDEE